MHTVLIVDDAQEIRELLSLWLRGAYDVREAPDAETALELMTLVASDVVLCDVEMPGQGGLWLTAQMQMRFPNAAVVLATAIDSIPPAVSFKSNISGYMVKPFARTAVVSAVQLAVAHHLAALAKPPAPTKSLEALLGLDPDTH